MPAARSSLGELGRDLARIVHPGPRMADQAEAVCSVLLAICMVQMAGVQNVGWAAFSGFMVIRSHIATSGQRAVLRVVGTVAGALLGYVAALHFGSHLVLDSAALLCVGTGATYMALTHRRTYAWFFTGLSFLMVLVESGTATGIPPDRFAWTRVMEVALGTGASLLVSLASARTLRRLVPGTRPPPSATHPRWHGAAAWHALQAGVATAMVPLLVPWVPAAALSQAGITVMAIMLVPLAGLDERPGRLITRRMGYRVAGCAAGALLALLFLLPCHASPPVLVVGICLGVAVGRYVENGTTAFSYAGMQFTLAFLVVLVPDDFAHPTARPGLERLLGILIGIALLTLVRWFARLAAGRDPSQRRWRRLKRGLRHAPDSLHAD